MPKAGEIKVKTFDFPPRSMVLLTMDTPRTETNEHTPPHPLENYDTCLHTFFGGMQKIRFVVTYGTFNQSSFKGQFSGNQCTSMSLAALAWWFLDGKMGLFTTNDINKVLKQGDEWHTKFRTYHNMSTEDDKRVALDEIPRQFDEAMFGRQILITRSDDDMFLLTSPASGVSGFSSLEDYLASYLEMTHYSPGCYLLTIGPFSNALMYTPRGTWLWYDSHGGMRVNYTRCKKYGCVVELASLRHVIMFIVSLRGPAELCQIVPMKFYADEKLELPKKPQISGVGEAGDAPIVMDIAENEEGLPSKPVEVTTTPDHKIDITDEKNDITDENIHITYEKIDITDEKIDTIDEEIDIIEEKIDITEEKIDIIDEEIDIIEEKIDITEEKIDIIDEEIDMIEEKIDISEEKIDIIDEIIDIIDEEIDIIAEEIDTTDEKIDMPDEESAYVALMGGFGYDE